MYVIYVCNICMHAYMYVSAQYVFSSPCINRIHYVLQWNLRPYQAICLDHSFGPQNPAPSAKCSQLPALSPKKKKHNDFKLGTYTIKFGKFHRGRHQQCHCPKNQERVGQYSSPQIIWPYVDIYIYSWYTNSIPKYYSRCDQPSKNINPNYYRNFELLGRGTSWQPKQIYSRVPSPKIFWWWKFIPLNSKEQVWSDQIFLELSPYNLRSNLLQKCISHFTAGCRRKRH